MPRFPFLNFVFPQTLILIHGVQKNFRSKQNDPIKKIVQSATFIFITSFEVICSSCLENTIPAHDPSVSRFMVSHFDFTH